MVGLSRSKFETYSSKKEYSILRVFCLKYWLLFTFLLPTWVFGQDGEAIFKRDCSACHKLGTKLVGPDLQQVTSKRSEDWFKNFVRSSKSFINSGDPDAKAIFEEFNQLVMPDNTHLSEEDLSALYAYLGSRGGETVNSAEEAASPPSVNYSQQEIKMGRALFLGKDSFTNGGASCISCHHANHKDLAAGGLLAKDLTQTYSRLGDEAIRSIVTSPPFPVMTEAYRTHKLIEEEVVFLAAFLQDVDAKSGSQEEVSADFVFFKWGLGVFAGILIAVGLIWRKRKSKSVKSTIFERQLKSI